MPGDIIATAKALNVPVRGLVLPVAVAMQESTLINVNHGDQAGPSSRGLFQQLAAWGPEAIRMDPAGATRLFFTGGHAGQHGLLAVPHWETLPLAQAAQAVQISPFPHEYAKWETPAVVLVTESSAILPQDPLRPVEVAAAHADRTGLR